MQKLKINEKRLCRLTSKMAASIVPHMERVEYAWSPIDDNGLITLRARVYAKAYDHASSHEVYYIEPDDPPLERKKQHRPLLWRYRQNEEVLKKVQTDIVVHLDPWLWRTEIVFDKLTKRLETAVVPAAFSKESNPDWECYVHAFYDRGRNTCVYKGKNNTDVYTFCYTFRYMKWVHEDEIIRAMEDL